MNPPGAQSVASGHWDPPGHDLVDPASGLVPPPGTGAEAWPAVRFSAWQATCRSFGAAIAAGPGMVALVGPPGSGKTYTFRAFVDGPVGQHAAVRSPRGALLPRIGADLVDGAVLADLPALADLRSFGGARALAISPALVGPLQKACRSVRVVYVKPMTARDVRVVLEDRREYLALPAGSLTLTAIARLADLSGGNPRRLDDLLYGAYRLFTIEGAIRIAVDHVDEAAAQIQAETMARQAGVPYRGRVFEAEPDPWIPDAWMDDGRDRGGLSGGLVMSRQPVSASVARRDRMSRRANAMRGPVAPALGGTVPAALAHPDRTGRSGRLVGYAVACAALAVVAALGVGLTSGPGGTPDRDVTVAARATDEAAIQDKTAMTAKPLRVEAVPAPPVAAPPAAAPPVAAPSVAAPPAIETRPIQSASIVPTAREAPPVSSAPAPPPPRAIEPAAPPVGPAEASTSGPGAADLPPPAVAPLAVAPLAVAPPAADVAPVPDPPLPIPPIPVAPPATPAPAARAAPKPRGSPAEAARLLALAQTLLSIGQVADALHVAKAAAEMGNAEAAQLLATHQQSAAPTRMQSSAGPRRPERSSARRGPAAD